MYVTLCHDAGHVIIRCKLHFKKALKMIWGNFVLIHLKYRGVFVYKLHAGCVIRLKLSLIVSETRYISLIKVSKQK